MRTQTSSVPAHVDVRGVRLAVSALGHGRADVLWAHGLTGSRAQDDDMGLYPWDLSPTARVLRYDVRGHGESSGTTSPEDYQWPELAKDALGLADGLGLETFVAGGSSLGAAVGVHLAVMAPDRVKALVLLVPPAAWTDRPPQAEIYEKMAAIIARKGAGGFADLVRGRPPYPFLADAMPDLPDHIGRHVRQWDAPHISAALRGAAASDLPDPGALAELEVPTLVVTWVGEASHPESSAIALSHALPRSELHLAHDVAAVLGWRDLVLGFLERLE